MNAAKIALVTLCGLLAVSAIAPRAPAMDAATAPAVIPAYITQALADPLRPPADLAQDERRRPAELLAFAGVQPGDQVADFMSGGGYFTRLLSRIVGAAGRVYAFLPEEELSNCAPAEVAGTRTLVRDPGYANVLLLRAPVARFTTPAPLDLIWTSQTFHDLYDSFMGPADVTQFAQALFVALKAGGALVVVDHVAQAGSGIRDTETLHRIDPQVIIQALTAAGFELEAQSALLRNPADTHELRVFDAAIRGHTDQVVLKFRKPRSALAFSAPSAAGVFR